MWESGPSDVSLLRAATEAAWAGGHFENICPSDNHTVPLLERYSPDLIKKTQNNQHRRLFALLFVKKNNQPDAAGGGVVGPHGLLGCHGARNENQGPCVSRQKDLWETVQMEHYYIGSKGLLINI